MFLQHVDVPRHRYYLVAFPQQKTILLIYVGSPCCILLLNYDVLGFFSSRKLAVELLRVVMQLVLFIKVFHFLEGRCIDQSKVNVSLDDGHKRQRVRLAQIHYSNIRVLLWRETIYLIP